MLDSLKAVLFDIDGTLLDTFDFIYGAFEHAFEVHGVPPLTRQQISHLMGGPLEEVYRTMAAGFDACALSESHREFQSNNLALAKLFPGTVPVLEAIRARNLKIAAITTRSLRTSVRSLEQTGIVDYFDAIISAEDVGRHKPDPEPLLKALELIEVAPKDAVMVGDTPADIEAGKNAGTATVAALFGFAGQRLLDLRPDYAIHDLTEVLTL